MGYSDFQFKTPNAEVFNSITPGTVLASKAVITDANSKINTLDITAPKFGGTAITSSAAELNLIDTSVAGTAVASKALVLGADKNVDVLAIADLKLGAGAGTSVTTQINSLINFPGTMSTSVIDFNTTGEPAMKVVIDGVDYQEADVAVVTNGVWTNGASAANSATSLVAAINGDTRATVPFTATISAGGHSVILTWDAVGTTGNKTITTTSASNCTVENSVGGSASAIKQMVVVDRVVTAQDILANEINVPLPFAPTKFIIQHSDTNGEDNPTTWRATIATVPNRIKITGQGVTALIAGDVVQILAFE